MGSREGRGADLVPGGGVGEERGGDGEGEEEEGEGAPRHRIGRRGIRLREGGGGGRREVGREISEGLGVGLGAARVRLRELKTNKQARVVLVEWTGH
jgi:hypothetical protein